ncbi:hypothetical protein BaRGS_00013619 [Batillaria attramentaria]|uniref:Uncharacterized protein n=1 Tax=Batillaria attramentaria TaxID=370345 RepID=A0ABD0L6J0_9CAEN
MTTGLSQALLVTAEGSTGKESQKDLRLRCQCHLAPGEQIYLVTWSKILNGDAITIFKKFPLNTGSNEYVFSGSWKGRGAVYDASTTADVILPGSNLSRNDAGLYRCEVTTDRETIHDDVAVEAKREPFLTLPSIQRDQAGVYTCIAHNTVSRGRTGVVLDVQYPAAVADIRFAAGGSELKVKEGQSVSMVCRATGNPPPTSATWSVTGRPKLSNQTYEMRYGRDYSSVYVLASSTCNDNDIYTCTTTNGLQSAQNASVRLFVDCAPKMDTSSSSQMRSTLKVGFTERTKLSLSVTARPQPFVQWLRFTGDSLIRVYEEFDVIYDDVRARLTTELPLRANSSEKYGRYTVMVGNEEGFWTENFTVYANEPPQCPENVTVFNISASSFCLSWKPGFDGGARQTMLLTYSTGTRDVNATFDDEMDEADDYVQTTCLEGLEAATEYRVVFAAENVFGRSKNTWTETITTHGEMRRAALESSTAPWVEVATPLVVGIALLVVVVVICLVARKRSSAMRVPEITIQIMESSEQYYNDGVHANFSSLEDKGRRPSSTPSANIYMDVLGDPLATYVNQEVQEATPETLPTVESYDSLSRDYGVGASGDYQRLSNHSQQYIDMTQGARGGDVTRTSSISYDVSTECLKIQGGDVNRTSIFSDVGTESSTYDDAWNPLTAAVSQVRRERASDRRRCASMYQDGLSPRTAFGQGRSTTRVCRPRSVHGDVSRAVPADGISNALSYEVDDLRHEEDPEEDIYDVIRDSDVESLPEEALYQDGQSERAETEGEQTVVETTYTNVTTYTNMDQQ